MFINILAAILSVVVALLAVMAVITRLGVWQIERNHPPAGSFTEVNGTRMHYLHVKPETASDLPPIVFLHGASGNLKDPMLGLRQSFEGRAEMLFVDRPGHGWSERGPEENKRPDGQAATVAALMDHLGIKEAIIAGHSFGGAIAAAFAVTQKEKTQGLLLMAPATHPWPGGETTWYYSLTTIPVIGWLFSETLSLPAGSSRLSSATACVFAPNEAPSEYDTRADIPLVLRPAAFRANAADVAGLHDFVSSFSERYKEIEAPTVIITGNRDTVVFEEIHSVGLKRDIPNSELVWINNLGHKPDYIVPELVLAAAEKISGKPVDLDTMAKAAERRIADDRYGPIERCPDEKPEPVAAE